MPGMWGGAGKLDPVGRAGSNFPVPPRPPTFGRAHGNYIPLLSGSLLRMPPVPILNGALRYLMQIIFFAYVSRLISSLW